MTIPCFCQDQVKEQNSPHCFCQFWLFENFTEEEYTLLKSIGKQRTIPKGDTIFWEGAPADEIFLIKKGRVKLSKSLEDGSEVILDFRQQGDLFGENAFGNEEVFPMSAWALEESFTCGAKKADLEKLILQNPAIGLRMMKTMSRKMATLTNRLEHMAIGNLEDRLYHIIKNIATEHGHTTHRGSIIPFPLTHEDLSFLVHAHRVSVTKAMKQLLTTKRVQKEGKLFILPH